MATTLDEALDNLTTEYVRKGPECTIAVLLRTLPEVTAQKVLALIDNPDIAATRIADTLAKSGHPIYVNALRRHRGRGTARGCACK